MKLDRNVNADGRGKYALVNWRKMDRLPEAALDTAMDAIDTLQRLGVVTVGNESPGDQFFVMKWKDKYTQFGLIGYMKSVQKELNQIAHGLVAYQDAIEGDYAPSPSEVEQIGKYRELYGELRQWRAELEMMIGECARVPRRMPD